MSGREPWLGVEVRHLAALKAVAEERSFNAAARRLGYSQSAVSQQIAKLEQIVGAELLTRPATRAQPVEPTEAGRVVLAEAEAILVRLRAADHRVRAVERGQTALVRVGLLWGVASIFLSQALERFPREAPDAELAFTEAVADGELFRGLDRGELDLAFVVLPPESGPYEFSSLLLDEFLLVVTDEHPLASEESVPLDALHRQPVLVLRRCRGTTALLGELARRGVEPEIVFRSDDSSLLAGLARPGDALLLPALHVGEHRPPLRVVRFDEEPHRSLGLSWHVERPPEGAVATFAGVCRELLAGAARLAPQRPGEPSELRVSIGAG